MPPPPCLHLEASDAEPELATAAWGPGSAVPLSIMHGSGSVLETPGCLLDALLLDPPPLPNLDFIERFPLVQAVTPMEELVTNRPTSRDLASLQLTVLAFPSWLATALGKEGALSSSLASRDSWVCLAHPASFLAPACFFQPALTQQHRTTDACKLLRNVNRAILKQRC